MLKDYIKEEYILLNQTASNAEEAIRLAVRPLEEGKVILPSYTEDILAGMKEYGPYFVIAKNIALPHGRCEAGALKDAFGITVLKTPVSFGSACNDPVKFLFPLSATDNHQHMAFISSMAELLSDQSFLDFLSASDDPKEILKWLSNHPY